GANTELFEDEAHDNRHINNEQPREYHLLQCPSGHNIDALPVGRLLSALQDTRMLAELPPYFIDHVKCCCTNSPRRHSRKQKDQHRSQHTSDIDLVLGNVHLDQMRTIGTHFVQIRRKEQEGREGGTTDGIPLGQGLGGIAYRVQTISFVTNLLRLLTH